MTLMSTPDQVAYFEGVMERAAEKLQKLPKNASPCKRLATENRYAYAVRCHQEAVAGRKWLPCPPREDENEP